MSILLNGAQPKGLYLGDTAVKSVYRGDSLVWKKSRLPDVYQEVEWIHNETTKTYIDTNVARQLETEVILRCSLDTIGGDRTIFGARAGGDSVCNIFGQYSSNFSFVHQYEGETRTGLGDKVQSNVIYDLNAYFGTNHSYLIANGRIQYEFYKEKSYTDTVTYWIFARNNNGSVSGGTIMKLYRCVIYINGSTIRDFVPCYRKSDGEVGMYDLCGSICELTGTSFYTNAGTGEFTNGPDV